MRTDLEGCTTATGGIAKLWAVSRTIATGGIATQAAPTPAESLRYHCSSIAVSSICHGWKFGEK